LSAGDPIDGYCDGWLHHSLCHFKEKIEALGAKLIIKKGKSAEIINELCAQAQIKAVAWNKLYEPSILKRDEKIVTALRGRGIEVKQFNGALLIEPWQLQTKSNSPYKVFTPYFKSFPTESPELLPSAEIKSIQGDSSTRNTLSVEDLNLLPTIRWDSEFYNHWRPGESHGQKLFRNFLNSNILDYKKSRDYPAQSGTSKISPYLHFGELSPKWILAEWRKATSNMRPKEKDEARWLIRELIWREFSHNILFHFPHTSDAPLDETFQRFPWKKNEKLLAAWKKGETGFEIVDAGMKELWATGWMHNRVRMIVASFLTKDLLISWREGALWFWDTLVDANLANNTMGWQWAEVCGAGETSLQSRGIVVVVVVAGVTVLLPAFDTELLPTFEKVAPSTLMLLLFTMVTGP
jgi:deoxyribodipyrimidine photo-lyase